MFVRLDFIKCEDFLQKDMFNGGLEYQSQYTLGAQNRMSIASDNVRVKN